MSNMKKEPSIASWVPVLTSQAGSVLTYDNWQRAGVQTVSLHLDKLLMKPGFPLLESISGIRDIFAWQHTLVLNAILPPPDSQGTYSFRSIYDGSLISIDVPGLVALVFELKPDIVILPPEAAGLFYQFLVEKPINIQVFIPEGENLPGFGVTAMAGLFLKLSKQKPFATLLHDIKNKDKNFYLMGDFSFDELKELASFSNCYVESNMPAEDGMTGIVYTLDGSISILNDHMRDDFNLIDSFCTCETCKLKLTRSYLHHLLQHTPLLAQRFLIEHNVCSFLKTTFTFS